MASWLALALTLAVVFAGGVLGGISRYALTRLISNARAAIVVANVSASVLAGVAAAAPAVWQLALGAGFSGALSTWSTFARQVGDMTKEGRRVAALRLALGTAALGVAGAWAGLVWGRQALGG